jgi:sulfatase maturation enzyme AslB (radical SAM superfamily)
MCAVQRHATKAIKPSGYMDLSLFKRLVDEVARDLPSIEYVYLHKDGEPLLHPDIVEMIQYASSRHPNVTLVTNATLLDDRMARAILATPLQKIRLSVDGLTRKTFEKIRIQLPSNEFVRTGTDVGYHAVMTNIERFLHLRQQTGNTTLNVGIRTTNFKPTSGEIDATGRTGARRSIASTWRRCSRGRVKSVRNRAARASPACRPGCRSWSAAMGGSSRAARTSMHQATERARCST